VSSSKVIAVLGQSMDRYQPFTQRFAAPAFSLHLCTRSEALFELAQNACIDVIVVEQRQPGFFTGLELLAKMAKALYRPTAVLVGDLSSQEREEASRQGIHAVLAADTQPASVSDSHGIPPRRTPPHGFVPRGLSTELTAAGRRTRTLHSRGTTRLAQATECSIWHYAQPSPRIAVVPGLRR